ncbi:hypothetical protein NC653_025038 [Populus alba x Populus x berolinensis]|uniref:RNase H type-1 domain-containing protein n=1 Tax=Populus alba x Populus x berolinensis TaxID=444605 RepID=A0AAD6MA80_9ROSI|nr:hypothetical protein NC653_025038 [Populus alba x Populus x berolinensis]
MNCLSRLSSYTASIFGRTSHFIATTATNSHQSWIPFWRRSCVHPDLHLEFLSTRFRVQCYSSRKPSLKASVKKKKDPQPTTVMDHENDAFFVVRKGDVVGVYKNFADCQAQVGSSICDPPVSVYKGYSLSKDSEAYLVSHGLQNALYTVRAADLKEDLFGVLMPCPLQQPASSDAETCKNDTKKRSREVLGSEITDTAGSTSMMSKHANLDNQAECPAQNSNSRSCLLEFDGASKGNPGQAGAGAVLRTDDGSLICRLREGLGIATNNMAEYRAILLGMKYALQKGYTKIQVKGDSKLVCMQLKVLFCGNSGINLSTASPKSTPVLGVGFGDYILIKKTKEKIQGSWKAKHVNITNLCTEAKKLKNSFLSFHISHVLRQPASSDAETCKNDTKKRSREVLGSEITDTAGSTSMMCKHANLDNQAECQAQNSNSRSCLLEFDGASKGNPGQAGAGAVLRTDDGSLICRLREGLGIATNNMAEYRAILLGMKYALQKGYTKIQVKGDSKLVCMQIQGSWKAKHVNITNLCTEAKKLKNSFLSFHISHVLRVSAVHYACCSAADISILWVM